KAGNYVLSSSTATVGADITKATITVTAVASDKVYDGTTDAQVTLAGVSGIVAGDYVMVSIESASFDDANAGENKTVNVTYEVTGADAGNYTVEAGGVTADITKAALTLSFTAADKVYDGTTDAEITDWTLTGLVDGETATVSGYAGAFADKNVGADKAVTVSGATITGVDLGNYELTTAGTTASITPAALTVNFTAEDKAYDGTAAATVTGYELIGYYAGDDVTVTVNSASFADKNVGTDKAVTVDFAASGADASNYTISAGTAAADISAIELLVVFAAEDKVYDGTAAATASLLDVVGLIDGDDVTVTANNVTFNDKNAGAKTASAESYTYGGADAGNYIILASIEGAVITPKALTITGTTVADKNYDGTTVAAITLGEVGGVLDGETVAVAAAGAFPSAVPGTYGVEVTYTISGADAANYAAPARETISAKILAPETPSMHVTTDIDVVDAYDGVISLREALGVYFQTDGTYTLEADGTITYGKDATNVTVTFDDDLTEIKANSSFTLTAAHDGVVINGVNAAGQENHILFKGNNFSVFTVSGNIEAAFNNLIFRDNVTEGDGAAIDAYGNITVSGSEFSGNKTTDGNGGAIRAHGALTVIDSTFTGNASSGSGGAISAIVDVMTVTGSKFTDNTAGSFGGAISAHGALTVTDSEFAGNAAAKSFGGAISANGALTVTDCDFIENTSETSFGGAIFSSATLTVTGSTFTGNRASTDAGAIFATSELLTVSGSTFSGNSSQSRGGAIFTSSVSVTDSTFTGNESGVYGGAIYSSTATVTGSTFTENVSRSGGALSGAGGDYTIDDSTFTGNRAGYNGGAISASSATVTGSTFTGNTADNNGGAIAASSATVTDSEFTENTANGGAIFVGLEGTLTVSGSKFTGNTSNGEGGAILTGENSTATVSDSTFTGNTSNVAGGAIAAYGDLTVNTSVLTGNAANRDGGAIYVWGGNSDLTVYQSLIAENTANGFGGGIFVTLDEGNVNVLWSTVAGNTTAGVGNQGEDLLVGVSAVGNPNMTNIRGSIVLNIESHAANIVLTSSLYESVNNRNGTFDVSDPNNYQLQSGDVLFVGGTDPFEAYKLADDSVAINRTGIRTTTDNPTTDLAGNRRPYAGIYDYGAFEWSTNLPETPSMHVTTDQDVVNAYDGIISLREALTVYYQTDGTYTIGNYGRITYGKDESNKTVTFEDFLTEITPNRTYTLTAVHDGLVVEGDNRIVFDGKTFTIFKLTEAANLTFNGLTFKNISIDGDGSAFFTETLSASNGEKVVFNDSVFTGNSSGKSGGAIHLDGIDVEINGSTFTGNTTKNNGGAVCATGSVTVTDSTFTGNNTNGWYDPYVYHPRHGGAIYAASVTLTRSTFAVNSSASYGNAVYISGKGESFVKDCEFTGNAIQEGLEGGYGGAIYGRDATLTVSDSTFTDNLGTAGGAIDVAYITVNGNSQFLRNRGGDGGAINSLVAKITGAVFEENVSGGDGGALSTGEGSIVTDSTFIGNRAEDEGGAIQAVNELTVENCIMVGNSAGNRGGAIFFLSFYRQDPKLTVYQSLIADNTAESNGGGIHVDADVLNDTVNAEFNILWSTIAGNTNADFCIRDLISGLGGRINDNYSHSVNVHGSILPEVATVRVHPGYGLKITYTFTSSLYNSFVRGNATYNVSDPNNYKLRSGDSLFVGGTDPFEAYKLADDSVAINRTGIRTTADNPTTDLAGNTRPYAGIYDYGAFEWRPDGPETPSMHVTTDQDVVDAFDGVISLREALGVYFKTDGTYTIETDGSITYGKDASNVTVTFEDSLTEIKADSTFELTAANDGVVINGVNAAGQENHILFTGLDFSVFIVLDGIEAAFNNLIFEENTALSALIYATADGVDITVSGSEFTGNSATASLASGAAIEILNTGNLTVSDSTFTGNSVKSGNGGAIAVQNGTLTVTGSRFTGNVSQTEIGVVSGRGGAIYVENGTLTVTDSLFADNEARSIAGDINHGHGGAIYIYSGTLAVTGSEFTGNSADYSGGAIGFRTGTLTVTDSEFSGNSAATGDGGAIFDYSSSELTLTGCTFTENLAVEGDGGAVSSRTVTVTDSTFTGNSAGSGGAIRTYGATTVTDSTFTENAAQYGDGGAIFTGENSTATVSDSTFTGNTSNNAGGAIAVHGDLTVNTSVLTGNSAQNGDGGAIYVLGGKSALTVYQSLIAENTSGGFGGGIFTTVDEGDVNILWSTVAGNTSGFVSSRGGDLSVTVGSPTNPNTVNVFGSIVPLIENLGSAIVLTSSLYEDINNEHGTYDVSDPNNYQLQSGDVLFVGGTDPFEAYKLADDSVAINRTGIRTTTDNPTTDLAGNTRPYAGIYDYGAFEWSTDQPETPSMHVTTDLDVVDAYDGVISLREALTVYFQTDGTYTIASDGTITYGKDDSNVTVTFDDDLTEIKADSTFELTAANDGVVINGVNAAGQENHILFKGNNFSVFTVAGNTKAEFNNLIFRENVTEGDGAAIYAYGNSNITVSGSEFTENSADCGGAINANGALTVIDSTFTGNTVNNFGGAIRSNSVSLTVSGCQFTDNEAYLVGGALFLYDLETANVRDSIFTGNTAKTEHGGAIYSNGALTVSGSTFTNNKADGDGGAINSLENLTVTDSTFTGNSANEGNGGAIESSYGGNLTVTGCTFTDNTADIEGGAIDSFNIGSLTVTDSEFIGNSAGEAGAIHVGGREAAISGSYFTGNSATSGGGAIFVAGNLTLTDSILVGNSAVTDGGAIRATLGELTVRQSLIARNEAAHGGGIYAYQHNGNVTVNVNWSTVADNAGHDLYTRQSSSNHSTAVNVFGSILTNVHLDQTTTATYTSSIYQSFTGSGTHDISDANNYHLQSGDVLFVGGTDPLEAYKLADDSVAINATGVTSTIGNPTTDLAGNVRPFAGIYDYGAYEWFAEPETPSMHVTTDQDVVDAFDGVISLREALGVYFQTDGTYTVNADGSITYGKDTSNVTVTFEDSLTEIKANSTFGLTSAQNGVVINGVNAAGQANHIEFNGNDFSVFSVNGDIAATFSNLIFYGNSTIFDGAAINVVAAGADVTVSKSEFSLNSADSGGAIYANGALTVIDSTFTGNTVNNFGGAIRSNSVSLTVSGCQFTDNEANLSGGALFLYDLETANVRDSIFTGNTAKTEHGGAISNDNSGTLFVTGSEFTGNFAQYSGGAIFCNTAVDVTVADSTFIENEAVEVGGAIDALAVSVTDSTFTKNRAQTRGGAINASRDLNVYHGEFLQNHSSTDGGAIYSNGDLRVTDSTFTGNDSQDLGGAIYADGGATVTGGTFEGNSAELNGGAIYLGTHGTLTVTGGTFTENSAVQFGGAIHSDGTLTVDGNSTFTGNTVNNSGGAIYSNLALTVSDSTFTENSATIGGGAIYAYAPLSLTVTDCTFTRNEAEGDGGAIYADGGIPLTVTGSGFTANISGANGGAIYVPGYEFCTVTDSTFDENTAAYRGGAINAGNLIVNGNSRFRDNRVILNGAGFGGAIMCDGAQITGAVFENNVSDASGGAICIAEGEVTDCTFTGNSASNSGGAIQSSGSLTLFGKNEFSGNSANHGGAIYYSSRSNNTLNVSGQEFSGNTASGDGGAIYMDRNSTLEVTDSTFTGNTANQNGGAIYGTNITVTDSTFTGSRADGNGGAIYTSSGTMTVTGGTFSGNTATKNGGAVYADSTLIMNGITFSDNNSWLNGGAVYSSAATEVTDCDFTGNNALHNNMQAYGGAIYFESALTVTDSTFTDNKAYREGGAIAGNGDLVVSNSTFTRSWIGGYYGGAIYVSETGTLTVSDSVFTENSASAQGGAIAKIGLEASISRCDFIANDTFIQASENGGAIYAKDCEMTVTDSKLIGNYGGAIYAAGSSSVTVLQSLIAENILSIGVGAVIARESASINILWSTLAGTVYTSTGGAVYDFSAVENATFNIHGSIVLRNRIDNNASGTYTSSLYQRFTGSGTYDVSDPNNYRLQSGDVLFVGGTDPLEAYKLADDSVAINATGVTSTTGNPTVDLAGNPRPYAGAYDYGAYEWFAEPDTPSMHVTTDQDVVNAFDGVTSLREALTVYYQTDGTYTIETDGTITYGKDASNVTVTFEDSLTEIKANSTFELTSAQNGVVINGVNAAGQANHIEFNGNDFSVFTVTDSIEAAFNNLIFRENVVAGEGAAINLGYSHARITVSGSEFADNATAGAY
ncbi:MAG: right-handed parallel beta-helix repeat-containing protein, partial [Thermoguttaceae bacterium]|nr:right-handed parallel beta-helix repeat-containing protein [Thermoguttaceae bacterium]